MPLIDSPQNRHVKLFRSLDNPKKRRESGLFALEGRHVITEALRAGAELEWAAYCPESFVGVEADKLLRGLLDADVELLEVTPRALQAMSQTVTPQGIAAVARIPQHTLPDLSLPARALLLGVWELRDPGNMGTMIRTAHACGAVAVLAVGNCVDFYDPKVVRASAGSLFHLPLLKVHDLDELRATLTTLSVQLVAADMAAPVACDEAKYPDRSLLLVGSEAHGLPEEVLAEADLQVRIPMPGEAESLNAAVAAGIIAFEITRQLYDDVTDTGDL